jgi:hypothetical protein
MRALSGFNASISMDLSPGLHIPEEQPSHASFFGTRMVAIIPLTLFTMPTSSTDLHFTIKLPKNPLSFDKIWRIG